LTELIVWNVDLNLREEVRGLDIEFMGPPFDPVSTPEESLASPWVTLTSGAGVGLYGDYEELIADTSLAGIWVLVQFMAGAGFQQTIFIEFDLAIGPIGSEVNFVDAMLYTQTTPGVGSNAQQDFSFPFEIPAGSRLSARSKDDKSNARDSLILVHVHG